MKVMIGGPCREVEGPLFNAWLTCLMNQVNVDTEVNVIHDTGSAGYDDKGDTHRWNSQATNRVGRLRQQFFDEFNRSDCDYAMMVDSDVLIGKRVAPRLIHEVKSLEAQVAYGVFWTDWGSGPQPQVWDVHPYGYSSPHVLQRLANGDTMVVRGGGACTLYTRTATDLCRYHPLIEGLPGDGSMWIGEDRTFALCCEVHRLKQIAVADQPIAHLYHPKQRTPEAINRALQQVGQP